VAAAAAAFPDRLWLHRPGPVARLVIAPGVLRVEYTDLAKRYVTEQRTRRRADEDRRLIAVERERRGDPAWKPKDPIPIRWVTHWSAKSRSRMVRTLAELDYTAITGGGRMPCLVTLTLPDQWQVVAPDGKTFKKSLKTFRKRWERAWGEPPMGIWKLEFQRRGAPHLHLFTAVPLMPRAGELRKLTAVRYHPAAGDGLRFQDWLRVVWADVIDHPDPDERAKHERAGTRVDYAQGMRMTDPKRVAVYFTKHAQFRSKEYQHIVPAEWREPGNGPGRFWGYWGLEKVCAYVYLTPDERIEVARTLRGYGHAAARARGAMSEREVIRGRRFRKVHRRVPDRLQSCSGYLCVNDGPHLAAALARLVKPDE
jgi:hypothetical protein